MKKKLLQALILLVGFVFNISFSQDKQYTDPNTNNPVIPGYFADPSLVEMDGKYYIYASTVSKYMEPMVWVSSDVQNWEVKTLDITGEHFFWAPSVIKGDDQKYYLYYTNGFDFKCHLFIGDSPVGPWKRYGLVEEGFDLQIFRDPNNARIYGSSSDPKSRPRLVEFESNPKASGYMTKVLKEKSLDGAFFDYTEGSMLMFFNGWYYLLYSGGKCDAENYKVNYARSKDIWGPYQDAPNNPILEKDAIKKIYGTGHNSVFAVKDQHYIVYHREDLNFYPTCSQRQVCIDKMDFDDDGWIKKISPTNNGIDFSQIIKQNNNRFKNVAFGKKVTASGTIKAFNPELAVDQNNATYWIGGSSGFFAVDLGKVYEIEKIIPKFLHYDYFLLYKILCSSDNQQWETYYDQSLVAQKAYTAIPEKKIQARYVKIQIVRGEGDAAALCEFEVLANN